MEHTQDQAATRKLRATAHPLRLQILSLLTGAELSAAEVARELGTTHANASYHLRQLLEAGQLEVASQERIRGGVAKRYRHPWERPEDPGAAYDRERRLRWTTAMAEELLRRVQHSTGRPGHFTDLELWVGEEDFEVALTLVEQASRILHAAARPPRTEGTTKVAMTAGMFEMDPS